MPCSFGAVEEQTLPRWTTCFLESDHDSLGLFLHQLYVEFELLLFWFQRIRYTRQEGIGVFHDWMLNWGDRQYLTEYWNGADRLQSCWIAIGQKGWNGEMKKWKGKRAAIGRGMEWNSNAYNAIESKRGEVGGCNCQNEAQKGQAASKRETEILEKMGDILVQNREWQITNR